MSYDGVVRADTPTRYWATRDTSGTTLVEDRFAANATLHGSAATLHQSGVGGSIINWADDIATYADGAAFNLGASFVVTAIVEVYSGSSGRAVIYANGTDPANCDTAEVDFSIGPSRQLAVTLAGFGTLAGSHVLAVGRHHVALYVGYGTGTPQVAIRIDGAVWDAFTNFTFGGTSGGHHIIRGGEFGLSGNYGVGKVALWNNYPAGFPFADAHWTEAVAGGGDQAPPVPGAASATGSLALSGSAGAAYTVVEWPDTYTLISGHNIKPLPLDVGDPGYPFAVRWVFTPDTSQTLVIDTLSTVAGDLTLADTVLYVFTGNNYDLNTATVVDSNDDAGLPPDNLLSRVSVDLVAGTTYYIVVTAFDASGNTITAFDVNAPFVGANLSLGALDPTPPTPPAPPDPNAAFFLTEIVSTLAPASGLLVESYVWSQVSPGSPVLDLHANGPVLRFINPPLLVDTDFVLRLTLTDNLGGGLTEDHTVHVKAHHHWALKSGGVSGIEIVRDLRTKYQQAVTSRSPHDLLDPYESVFVADEDGWLATFTSGARSVLLRRTDDPPALATSGLATFTPPGRLLLLPEPFDGTVDEVLLDEMVNTPAMDLYDRLYALANDNITMVNGVQVYGPNAYDATADFNDYLGITFDGDAPDMAKTGKLSPQGLTRLIYGPAGLGLPLAEIPVDLVSQYTESTAPGVSVIDTETYMPSGHMIAALQMGDILGFSSGGTHATHHIGIYLGPDSLGARRFISMRADKDGVSAQNGTLIWSTVQGYSLPLPIKYTGWLRSAQRY